MESNCCTLLLTLYVSSTGLFSKCWAEARIAALIAATALLCLPVYVESAEAWVTSSEAGDTLEGVPRVVDGDTLVVGHPFLWI